MNDELLKYFKNDELAAGVWLGKYADKGEITPDSMHRRMAKEFARIEKEYQEDENALGDTIQKDEAEMFLSKYGGEREDLTEETIYNLFKDFKYIVPQGSIMSSLGTDIIASLSNCWVVQSPHDSYGGILKTDSELAYYYKRRGGVGADISNLRPAGTSTNNTAKSSTGVVSFMHRFSNTTREVAMSGRRGALMLSLDVNHPDVMDFIKIKRDGTSVTGANISVKLNNKFMKAVENDEDYILRFPCDSKLSINKYDNWYPGWDNGELNYIPKDDVYIKLIKAKEYWDELVHSAKNYAEPGLMYWDNIIDYDPAAVYDKFKPVTSNPCGEQFLNPYDSCRLMALNLYSFVDNPFTDEATLNVEKLYKTSYEFARMGDNLIDLELEHIQRIIDKIKSDPEPEDVKRGELELWQKSYDNTKAGRRIGLGITALADMLAALNLKYDSDKGMEVIDMAMSTKMLGELDCTVDLSILRGKFDGWDVTKEYKTEVDSTGLSISGKNKFYQTLLNEFPKTVYKMYEHGRRNVSFSTIAPTGSVSLLTQTTSGCEPLFMPYYMRRKKINPGEEGSRVDFVDEIGDSWMEFPVMHQKFKDWLVTTYEINDEALARLGKEELEIHFKNSPWYGSTANDIDWVKRNEIQAILQKYTTNAISSTINLPSTVTEEQVSEIYMSGWKLGLKGQTVYVDGSRSGVLVDSSKPTLKDGRDSIKRPKQVPCDIHNVSRKGEKFTIIVGLVDDNPYEVFAFPAEIVNKYKSGFLNKKKGGVYNLTVSLEEEIDIYTNVTGYMTPEEGALTRLLSLSLRHGADIKYIVEQLNKTEGDLTTFGKVIARVLKKYIPDGTKSTLTCEDCGGTNVVFEEGCSKCLDCGSSKCG